MSIETLKSQLPEYAKDLKLNLASAATEARLSFRSLAYSGSWDFRVSIDMGLALCAM